MNYKINIVEQPARRLVGLCARINMCDSHKECPALWEKFMPRMVELAFIAGDGSFGASVNMDESGGFDYWAAMDVSKDALVPSGLSLLDVKGGKYAECVVENLANVGEAYQYIYGEWGNTQSDHRVDFTTACLEFYQKDWREGDPVTIYVPLQ